MRIVIVEDNLMFREMVRKVCTEDLQHSIVGETEDGRRAVELVIQCKPDLVLLDLRLPGLDGFGVVEAVRKKEPDMRILILSCHCDEYTVFRAERAQVQGFIDKNTSTVAVLKKAITAAAEGRVTFSDSFLRAKAARIANPHSFDKLLTDRERTLLSLIGHPLTDDEIASLLAISHATVEKHRFNLLRKLSLGSTTELVRYAQEHGFILLAPGTSGGAKPA